LLSLAAFAVAHPGGAYGGYGYGRFAEAEPTTVASPDDQSLKYGSIRYRYGSYAGVPAVFDGGLRYLS